MDGQSQSTQDNLTIILSPGNKSGAQPELTLNHMEKQSTKV